MVPKGKMQNVTLEMLLWIYLPACPPEGWSYAWWKGSATSSKTQRPSWGALGSGNVSGDSQLNPHTITCDVKVRLQMKPFFMFYKVISSDISFPPVWIFFFQSYWLKKRKLFWMSFLPTLSTWKTWFNALSYIWNNTSVWV